MRLFDCFTFFNELDLLELRLEELAPLVDRFVIAESTLTFTGREKPLFFADNRDRFARFAPQIVHVVVEDMPNGPKTTAWDREWHQRRALIRGLGEALPDDLVMLSDLDEIPHPEALEALRIAGSPGAVTILESILSLGYANTRPVVPHLSLVQAPRVLQRKALRDFQALRAFRGRTSKSRIIQPVEPLLSRLRALVQLGSPLKTRILPDSAWHFSYLGGAEAIREKLTSYAHTEAQTKEGLDLQNIARGLEERSFHLGGIALKDEPLDESFPATLRADPARWAALIAPTRAAG